MWILSRNARIALHQFSLSVLIVFSFCHFVIILRIVRIWYNCQHMFQKWSVQQELTYDHFQPFLPRTRDPFFSRHALKQKGVHTRLVLHYVMNVHTCLIDNPTDRCTSKKQADTIIPMAALNAVGLTHFSEDLQEYRPRMNVLD